MPDDKKPTTPKTPRAESFRQITVRLPLDPATRREALIEYGTRQGIEAAAALELLEWRKKLDDAAKAREDAEAIEKEAAAKKRKAATAKKKAKREADAAAAREKRLADRKKKRREKLEAELKALDDEGAS